MMAASGLRPWARRRTARVAACAASSHDAGRSGGRRRSAACRGRSPASARRVAATLLALAVLASFAPGVATAQDEPAFTATLSPKTSEHDGSSVLQIVLEFSEEPQPLSYRTIRDGLFEVTGGALFKAKRDDPPSNRSYTLHVRPHGVGPVQLARLGTLPACGAEGAVCAPGGRALSGTLSVTVPGPGSPPGAPQNLRASPDSGSVVLTWDEPSSDGNRAIERYEYRYAEGASVPPDTQWRTLGEPGSAGSLNRRQEVSGLTNGVAYTFEVRAVNEADAGPPAVATVTVPVPEPPSAPRNLQATAGDSSVVLRWERSESEGSAGIERYEYRYAIGSSVPESTAWLAVPPVSPDYEHRFYKLFGLTNGTAYAFEVRAVSLVGGGAAAVATFTPSSIPCPEPNLAGQTLIWNGTLTLGTGLQAVHGTVGYFRFNEISHLGELSDTTFELGSNRYVIVGITRSTVSLWFKLNQRLPNADESRLTLHLCDESFLVGDSRYVEGWLQWTYWEVPLPRLDWDRVSTRTVYLSVPAEGGSDENTAPAFAEPSATRSVEEHVGDARTTEETVVGLGDALVATDDDGDALTYTLEGEDADAFTIDEGTGQLSTKAGVGYDHEAKASYAFTVRADDGRGGSATVEVTVAVANVDEPPVAPAVPAVAALAGSETGLTVRWTAPGNAGRPAIESYDLQYRSGTSGDWTDGPDGVEGASATLGGLDEDTLYQVQVRAVNAEGDGAWSQPGEGRTGSAQARTLRLVGGEAPHEGRLEILHDGQWGTVCDDYWDKEDADVACRALGYEAGSVDEAKRFRRAYFGAGEESVPIWLDNLQCTGSEASLLECPRGRNLEVGEHNCKHREDVGVRCKAPAPVDGALPEVSVMYAWVEEGPDVALEFAVTLSEASGETVTVRWSTADGTAEAGEDYVAGSGTVEFAPGETEKAVSVEVLDDALDEGLETLTVTLSHPSGARLGTATAAGVISNADPLPQGWAVRFGRTVGAQAVDALVGRLGAGAVSQVTVAGIGLLGAGQGLADVAPDAPPFALPAWAASAREPEARGFTRDELLLGSRFHLTGGGGADGEGTAFTAWGNVATGGFEAGVGAVAMDGAVTTGFVGFDAEWERALAGVMLSQSRGTGGYRHDPAMGDDAGEVESNLTSVYPYARMALAERVSAWGLAGAGSGAITLAREGGGAMKTDLSMRMAALGAKGQVLDGSGPSGLSMHVRTDAMWVGTKSAKLPGELVATEGDVTRLRLTVDGERTFETAGGGTFTPSAELGVRHDGGDAETGAGLEVGAGVRYSRGGVSFEARARMLAAHEDSGYEEWGASAALRVSPGVNGRGLTLSIAPEWGRTGSARERLWSARDARGLEPAGELEATRRLVTEMGYGLGLSGRRGVVTPYAALSIGERSERAMRGGARFELGPALAIGLEASRNESGGEGANEARLRAALRF